MLKEQKKKEEQEEKERKKAEREKKRLEREQEKAQKQEQREAKKAEKQKQMEEKEKQKVTACKRGRSATTSKNQNVSQYKVNCPNSSTVKQYPKRRAVEVDVGPQSRSTSGDTCAVCCGAYVDDVDDITGEVTADWIQCTEDDCVAWSHVDCLDQDAGGGGYMCPLLQCIQLDSLFVFCQLHALLCNTGS